jgi:hypothetical protein
MQVRFDATWTFLKPRLGFFFLNYFGFYAYKTWSKIKQTKKKRRRRRAKREIFRVIIFLPRWVTNSSLASSFVGFQRGFMQLAFPLMLMKKLYRHDSLSRTSLVQIGCTTWECGWPCDRCHYLVSLGTKYFALKSSMSHLYRNCVWSRQHMVRHSKSRWVCGLHENPEVIYINMLTGFTGFYKCIHFRKLLWFTKLNANYNTWRNLE